MSDEQAVLFANEAFYQAFADGDLSAMDDVWSGAVPVVCIHPGWGALHGREQVMESWEAILGNDNRPGVRVRAARAYQDGDSAFVVCYEEIGQGFLVATNVFRREADGWKIVHHQAGPTEAPDEVREPDDEDHPDTVH